MTSIEAASGGAIAGLETVTRGALIKRLFRETGLGTYGSATSGSTTTIVDTGKLKSTQYNDQEWVGGWARISKDAGGAAAAPETEVRPITTYDPETGTITVNPAFSAAVAASDEYELWANPNPSEAMDVLDDILTEDVYVPAWEILTELPDGNMEQDNTTSWSDTNATGAKATTNPMEGVRYLTVTDSGSAGGYSQSVTMNVEAGKEYYISGAIRCEDASTSATLLAYDITNSADITSKTVSPLYMGRVWFMFTAPSGCKAIAIQLTTVEASKVTDWDSICLYPMGAREITLPWWVKEREQVRGVFNLTANEITTSLLESTLRGYLDPRWDVQDSSHGNNRLKLVGTNGAVMSSPLYIYGIRNALAYANDNSDGKFVPEYLLLSKLAHRVYVGLAKRPGNSSNTKRQYEIDAAFWDLEQKKASAAHADRLEIIMGSPEPMVGILDSRFQFGGM